ncbi:MAG: M48 family metallopeptidase [Verrucomicrobiota bacterium]
MKRSLSIILIATATLFGIRCTTVPETGRRAINLIPESQLNSMSLQAFSDMKASTEISKNAKYNNMVRRLGQRISAVVQEDFPDTVWEFVVFDDDQVNAFAMAGGKVGVYSGIIDLVDSEDELAVVIGHEIAHVTARHSNERMSQQIIAGGIGAALAFGTGELDDDTRVMILGAYGAGSQFGVLLPYSRTHENEADEIGLYYAARAGYDPRAAITFWEKMKAQKSGRTPEWASTHPSDETRINHLKEIMPRALELYQLYR